MASNNLYTEKEEEEQQHSTIVKVRHPGSFKLQFVNNALSCNNLYTEKENIPP
jgi:hypothetical protein